MLRLQVQQSLPYDFTMNHSLPDQRVDTSKAYTNAPKTCQLHNLLAQVNISRLEAEHSSWSTRHLGVQLVLRVRLQSRVVNLELVSLQEIGNLDGIGLLAIHAYRQRLDTPHQQPAVKRSQANSCGIDCEVDFLIEENIKPSQRRLPIHREPDGRKVSLLSTITSPIESSLTPTTPAIRSWCPLRYLVPE